MTPKAKAQQIVNDYMEFIDEFSGSYLKKLSISKKTATFAVNKIIESRKEDCKFDDTLLSTSSKYWTAHPMYLTYWLQVKEEIEKL